MSAVAIEPIWLVVYVSKGHAVVSAAQTRRIFAWRFRRPEEGAWAGV